MRGGHLVREARRRAGLTQAELAVRAGTTQSAVARVESGRVAPTLDRITRLVAACGLEVRVSLVAGTEGRDRDLASSLARSVDDRVRSNTNVVRFAEAARADG